MPILEHFVDRTPGSFVEEKKYALVWHYRVADPEFGAWLANELVSMLEAMLAETELRAFSGEKIVEVKPVWANKGEALERLLTASSQPSFLFAAGDDRTDEDLFERMQSASRRASMDGARVCGDEINPKRLEAVPWTQYCFECEQNLERGRVQAEPKSK